MSLGRELVKEIGNRSRKFYEFVLPPVDIHLDEGAVRVIIDMPGFSRDEISVSLAGSMLRVRASRDPPDPGTLVTNQRPGIIDKRIRLPVHCRLGDDAGTARYADGVLTVSIPLSGGCTDIPVD